MPKVLPTFSFQTTPNPSVQWLGLFVKALQNLYQQLARVVNGGATLGDGVNPDNISLFYATIVGTSAGVDFVLNHNLNRVPAGYLIVEKSVPCDVYTGSTAATATQITLRANVNGATLRIMVF